MYVNFHTALKRGNQLAINQRLGFNLDILSNRLLQRCTRGRVSLSKNYNNKFAWNITGIVNTRGFLPRRLIRIVRSQFFLWVSLCLHAQTKWFYDTAITIFRAAKSSIPVVDENWESIFIDCSKSKNFLANRYQYFNPNCNKYYLIRRTIQNLSQEKSF